MLALLDLPHQAPCLAQPAPCTYPFPPWPTRPSSYQSWWGTRPSGLGDPIVAATIGGVLTYPQIITWGSRLSMFTILASTSSSKPHTNLPDDPAAWLAKKLGDWLKKVLPSYLQMIFNPMITVLVVHDHLSPGRSSKAANGLAVLINDLVHASGWLGGLVIGPSTKCCHLWLALGVVPLVAQQLLGPTNRVERHHFFDDGFPRGRRLGRRHQVPQEGHEVLGIAAAISAFCG